MILCNNWLRNWSWSKLWIRIINCFFSTFSNSYIIKLVPPLPKMKKNQKHVHVSYFHVSRWNTSWVVIIRNVSITNVKIRLLILTVMKDTLIHQHWNKLVASKEIIQLKYLEKGRGKRISISPLREMLVCDFLYEIQKKYLTQQNPDEH